MLKPDGGTPQYNPADIESLDHAGRQVLLAVARQTGVLDADVDSSKPPDESAADGDGNAGQQDHATTRTIRKATGLDRNKINYRFKVLEGRVDSGCDPALITTSLPPIKDDGTMPPKEVQLTAAGKAAVASDAVQLDPAPEMPEWVTTEDIAGQVEEIAEFVDALDDQVTMTQAAINAQAQHLGFNSIEHLIEILEQDGKIDREAVLDDDVVAGKFAEDEQSIIATLAIMYQGMEATEQSLRDLGTDPMENFTPPAEVQENKDSSSPYAGADNQDNRGDST